MKRNKVRSLLMNSEEIKDARYRMPDKSFRSVSMLYESGIIQILSIGYVTTKKIIVFILLLFPIVIFSQETKELSLFDCYKLANENHPYYQDKKRIVESTDLKIRNINSQWLPQLSINGQATYQSDAISLDMKVPDFSNPANPVFRDKKIESSKDQYKATFDINQVIYDGGSISAQKKITIASSQADSLQNESELHKINEQVNQIYFGLLLFRENKRLLEVVKSTLEKRLKTIEAGVKNGIMQESDLENIKIEILKNQQQTDELKLSFSYGINILAELTGMTLNDSLSIDLPEVNFYDTGNFQRTELKALDIQKTNLLYSDRLVKSQTIPKLYAFSQAGYGRPGLNMLQNKFSPYYIVGLSLKWNLWDWNKTSRDRQSLSIQRDMIESRKRSLEKNLRIALDNSKSRIDQLDKALIIDQAIVELRGNLTRRSTVKLEQGVITATDYINDLNAETQARIQMETHKIQLVQEKVNYLTIKGIL
jgi:outer membrane protein TolC